MTLTDGPPPNVNAAHNLLTDLTVGQILAILATLAVIVGFIRTVNPIMRRLNDMLDDWNGEKARPGVPERKGVLERVGDLDDVLTEQNVVLIEQNEVLSHLRKKVEPLVDDKAKGNHREVLSRLDRIDRTTSGNGTRLHHLESLLARHIRESKAWVSAVDKATAERDFVTPPWPSLPDDDDEGK